MGKKVKTITDGNKSKGIYTIKWNGTNSEGNNVDAGIYFIKITSNDFVQTIKLIKQ